MAAPQVAGAATLLLSAATQSKPALLTKNTLIHRAIKFSATPIKGYTYLDQGSGVINVPRAFDFLKNYAKNYREAKVYEFDISTECPSQSDGFVSSAYWRTGGYYPANAERQAFTIRPIFGDSVDADTRANFYRAFDLKSTDPWLFPVNKSAYLKGEKPATVNIKYNPDLLDKPGLYCGKVIGYRKQQELSKYNAASAEFELLSTVIIPYIFDHHNKYQQDFQKRSIKPGDVDRYFILVPTGATSAKITLSPAENRYCNVNGFGYSPDGINYFATRTVTSKEQNEEIQVIPSQDLIPGIWEIDIYADFQNDQASVYDLSISFSSFKIEPPLISDFNFKVGQEPKGYLKVANQFNIPFYGFGRGRLSGYQRTQDKIVTDRDTYNYDFQVDADVEKVEFEVDFDDDSFLRFTDVAINVYDPQGRAIFKDALTQDKGVIVLDRIAEGSYTLEIVAAHAYSAYDALWKFKLTEKYFTRESINFKIYQEIDRLFKLYPFITRELEFTLDRSPRIPPDGFHIFGSIEFMDRNLLQQVFTVPVLFR